MENITIYYKDKSNSYLQVINWFKEHNITVNLKKINTITQREIFQVIYLSGLDVPDILRNSNKYLFLWKRNKLNKLRFSESLSFLEHHTELLEVPIILSNKYAILGYDEYRLESLVL
jgi:Arsenate reductase and related proteins, glutaredoxin family